MAASKSASNTQDNPQGGNQLQVRGVDQQSLSPGQSQQAPPQVGSQSEHSPGHANVAASNVENNQGSQVTGNNSQAKMDASSSVSYLFWGSQNVKGAFLSLFDHEIMQ